MSNAYYHTHLKNNPEFLKRRHEYSVAYNIKNKEKIRLRGLAYREKNKDRLKAEKAEYFQNNKVRLRQKWNKQVLRYRFGLTPEQYDLILSQQNGVCAICGKHRLASNQIRMGVDHCHETEKVRGILCNWCNTSLGHFGDSIELLQKAIEYLKLNGSNLNIGELIDTGQYTKGTRNMRYTRRKKSK